MDYHFELNPADLPPIVAMLLVTVSFCSYWFLFVSQAYKKMCYSKYQGDEGKIFHIISLKYLGVIMLGVVPVSIFHFLFPGYGLASFGLFYNASTMDDSLLWIVCIGIPVIIFMKSGNIRPKVYETYPQIRIRVWDRKLIGQYSTAWAFFMFGYEVLFRGLLLFPLVERFGVFPAIAINTVFYVGSHIPKGSAETYAALFFGPLLCFITLSTGTIWAAGFIHVILAVSNSIMSPRFHPDMIVVKNRFLNSSMPGTIRV